MMLGKKNLCLTCSQRKQKLLELEHNAPIKQAQLLVMKGLVLEYLSSNMNAKFHYNMFYKQKCLPVAQEGITTMAYYKTTWH